MTKDRPSYLWPNRFSYPFTDKEREQIKLQFKSLENLLARQDYPTDQWTDITRNITAQFHKGRILSDKQLMCAHLQYVKAWAHFNQDIVKNTDLNAKRSDYPHPYGALTRMELERIYNKMEVVPSSKFEGLTIDVINSLADSGQSFRSVRSLASKFRYYGFDIVEHNKRLFPTKKLVNAPVPVMFIPTHPEQYMLSAFEE